VLVAPTDHGEYVLDMDASDFALIAVLQQKQDDGLTHVIAYGSRSLSSPEHRYCITRKEMLAVVFGLKKYRQHLLGRKILIRTDHAALTYLKRTPEPIGQQGRWLDFLSEFDYHIEHRSGSAHGNSDALLRRPCEPEGAEPCPQCVKGTTAGTSVKHRVTTQLGSEGELADPESSLSDATSSPPEWDYGDEVESESSDRDRDGTGQLGPSWQGTPVPVPVVQFEPMEETAHPDPVITDPVPEPMIVVPYDPDVIVEEVEEVELEPELASSDEQEWPKPLYKLSQGNAMAVSATPADPDRDDMFTREELVAAQQAEEAI